jgi:hypothetical protein
MPAQSQTCWAGMLIPPRAAADDRIQKHEGKNYDHHGDHGDNAVVVRSDANLKVIYHECTHAILRQLGLNSGHSSTFRKLAVDLYDAHLPGFSFNRLEAEAIAEGVGVTVDWTFDLDEAVRNHR